MLHSLTVSNIVLIERLTLSFEGGLTVLTGETGAGKSILLDALGLALGSRADFRLIREGADAAHVSAVFRLDASHPVWARLAEADIPPDEELILRRRLKADGKSSASINDVPVSAALLRKVGDTLVEIQGQFEGRGLLDTSTHITLLDRAAGHEDVLEKLESGWKNWLQAQRNLARAKQELEKARAEEEWLRDAVEQLDLLAPTAGEEAELSAERERLANVGRIGESLGVADDAIFGETGAQSTIGRALAALEKAAPYAGGILDEAKSALERADAELSEAGAAISGAGHALESDPGGFSLSMTGFTSFASRHASMIASRTGLSRFMPALRQISPVSRIQRARWQALPIMNGNGATITARSPKSWPPTGFARRRLWMRRSAPSCRR
ncbi:MAG: hypothetical protein CM15mP115_18720 [Alphaproteobacteria bacterium]|nr:MAG: hypothetical protein CM15mP115_18720 [Alphaproteobacteria bacterium]